MKVYKVKTLQNVKTLKACATAYKKDSKQVFRTVINAKESTLFQSCSLYF